MSRRRGDTSEAARPPGRSLRPTTVAWLRGREAWRWSLKVPNGTRIGWVWERGRGSRCNNGRLLGKVVPRQLRL